MMAAYSRIASFGRKAPATGTAARPRLWRIMANPAHDPPVTAVEGPEDLAARSWKHILAATWKDSGEGNLPLIAAGVAFYALLAFVPLLTAFVLSYGLVAEPESVVGHMQTLTSIMPSETAGIIGDQLRNMTETSGAKTGFALVV